MPDGFIQLPADSTGKKLRTRDRGAAGHDQIVDVAAWPTYYYWTTFQVATATKIWIDIFNATGSGVRVHIPKLFFFTNMAAHTGAVHTFQWDKTSAVGTGGTALTANKANTDDANLPAGVTARHAPTGGATQVSPPLWQQGIWSEETLAPAQLLGLFNWMMEGDEVKELVLAENQGFSVRSTAGTVATMGLIAVIAVES